MTAAVDVRSLSEPVPVSTALDGEQNANAGGETARPFWYGRSAWIAVEWQKLCLDPTAKRETSSRKAN
ncbi:MAG: hypothetical protein JSR78_01160 [Proteobacteria bacterium]|nr:hypothetical protein [Pseudomonadota bacterium]